MYGIRSIRLLKEASQCLEAIFFGSWHLVLERYCLQVYRHSQHGPPVAGGPERGLLVISNTVDGSNRRIYILLDKRYFTEQHLRRLLRELFERYLNPTT